MSPPPCTGDFFFFRTYYLETQGFQVIRFWNQEILTNMRNALDIIALHISNSPLPPSAPSPVNGGRELLENKLKNYWQSTLIQRRMAFHLSAVYCA
ncbi:DUF559 domain-containing protein [Glaesserella parasuis]|uniref:DUF559 domain-containing protein n=1 Tax=Glaesserella parasuis TaxID=738 RepID=UPI0009B749C4|nr:DUF559 domain-containing protein [Glaesserella parasuis]